ncbi:MAG TPA: sigma-70 family RNA polymerase sigma factor [Patescibacteria group bacterium]|nr:sigma-70 family RNA polymerase sigma factor [Patescibacteria group bacterium]
MRQATETIWNEFSAQLRRFIGARVADSSAAEDILQDVFLKLQVRVDEFRDPTKLRGWLILVARNTIVDYYRARKDTVELTDSFSAQPEDDVEHEELKTVFHQLLFSLPKPYREALVLTEYEGLTQEQLAKHLRISLSGAKSRVQRAREQLKELLLDYCHQEFSRAVGSQPCPKGLLPSVGARNGTNNNKPPIRSSGRLRGKTIRLRK